MRRADSAQWIRALVGAAVLAIFAGCHSGAGGNPAAPASKPAAQKATGPSEPAVDPGVAEANRSMAAGVPIGNSTAPLEIRFDVASVPVPGEPFTVDIAVLPEAPAPVLRVEVTGGEGVNILDPEGAVTFEKVQAGTVQRLKVRASTATAGTRLVEVRATLELPAGPEARAFAFPIVVAAQPAPTPAAAAGTPVTPPAH
jgi:hypothetical protein